MKVLWGMGKGLALLFWVVVVINIFKPMINPFDLLISVAGSLLFLTHLLELLLFNRSLQGRPSPWRDRLYILLLGILHIQTFPKSSEQDNSHA
ncbi:DUF1145 domain-containing protein [Pseudomonas sp. SIMBA_077]